MRKTKGRLSRAGFAAALLAGSFLVAAARLPASEEPVESARIEVGQPAPEFTLTTATGGELSLSDVRGEKSLVLVFFRGTW